MIHIAAAANVTYAMDNLELEFNKVYPKIELRFTLASSGKLTAQIRHGAPYHIFMSANMEYPEALYRENIAVTKPSVYAKGSLAILSLKRENISGGLKSLTGTNIKRVAVANPKTAPYGKATFEALNNLGIADEVKGKFIYGDSISQTLSYTLKATNLGVVAKSSLYSPKMKRFKKQLSYIDVNSSLYTPIDQGVVILQNGGGNPDVDKFYKFLFSTEAKKIFREFGYKVD
jgi:molybdate transport system substrate-binding protein